MNSKTTWHQDLDSLPRGIFFAPFIQLFVVISLFLSLLYGPVDLTVFSLTLVLLAAGLKVWSSFSTRSLYYRVAIDKRRVFPGECIDFKVSIENRKMLPVLVKIRLAFDPSLVSDNRELMIREDSGALWYQTISFHHELKPVKRGVFITGSPRLITGDLFGFFPKTTREKQETAIMVYPRLIPLKPIPVINRIMFGKSSFISPVCDPVFILGTRDYRAFSSAKHIHWKASARHNKLQEKVFEATEQEKLLFILDGDGFIDRNNEPAFEQTIEALASLAIALDSYRFAVGFLTNCCLKGPGPGFLPATRNPTHLSSLLGMLANIEFKSGCRIGELMLQKPPLSQGATCVYFSYEPMTESTPIIQKGSSKMNISFQTIKTAATGKIKTIALQSLLVQGFCEAN
jgi:hypothetical protein